MLRQIIYPVDWYSRMKGITFLGLLLCAAGLVTSPAILSIGTFAVIIPPFISQPLATSWKKVWSEKAILFFVLIYPIHLLSLLWTENIALGMEDLRIKLPLFFTPLALAMIAPLGRKELSAFFAVLCLSVFVVGTGTVVKYFLHFDEINTQIAIAKPVETFLGLSHIYFSICLFAAVFCAAWLFYKGEKVFFSWEKHFFALLTVILIVYLHILTTRTGLIAFYGGCMMCALLFILRTRRYFSGIILFFSIIFIPVAAYYSMPSLRNRVSSTLIDLKAIYNHVDPNDYSLATRLEAWKTAIHIFQRSPMIGVSTADLKKEIATQYELDQTELEVRNREMPHNQFLEFLAGLGLLGFIPFIIGWCWPLFTRNLIQGDWLFPCLWIGLTLAMMVESVLERQVGVGLVSLVWGLLCLKKTSEKQANT